MSLQVECYVSHSHAPTEVKRYSGFREKPERLVYVYGRIRDHPEGDTLTVLPDGTLENDPTPITKEMIEDGTSRGLIAYTFPQTISESDLQKVSETLRMRGFDPKMAEKVAFYRDTFSVTPSIALVQSWKVKANKSFFEGGGFEEVEMEPAMMQACGEFEKSLSRLFNLKADQQLPGKIMAVKQKQWKENKGGLLRGTGAVILATMMDGKSGFDDMIVPGSVTFNSFETYVYGEGNSPKIIYEENGDPKTKRFYLSRNLEYAVYKNSGSTTHITPTPWYQFCFGRTHLDESAFH